MKSLKLPPLLLAFALLFTLAACQPSANVPASNPPEEISQQLPSQEPSAQGSEDVHVTPYGPVRLAVLSGPTGVGAAQLLNAIDNDPASLSATYEYTIAADNSELVAGLSNGEIDIATVASNVAANLFNKTGGGVKIIAVGTLGVLHILEGNRTANINSIADLAGKTLYAAGQGANPEYVLRYLLEENGLEIGKDVEVVFADAGEISAKLLSGEIECAMLPVPAATAAIAKGEGQVRQAVDMTEAWDALENGSKLIMTAVVARSELVETHSDYVQHFLTDYEASIDYVNDNVDEAAEWVADHGITPSAGIAKLAIPQCHLAFISGQDMKNDMSGYYSLLYSVDPASVGGALPEEGIYWIGN